MTKLVKINCNEILVAETAICNTELSFHWLTCVAIVRIIQHAVFTNSVEALLLRAYMMRADIRLALGNPGAGDFLQAAKLGSLQGEYLKKQHYK